MRLFNRAWTSAALIALALAVVWSPSAGLADDDNDKKKKKNDKDAPDLVIQYTGPGATIQVLRFVVTNAGEERAPATMARIETLSPLPANERTVPIPSLDDGKSFDFTYILAAPCNGHRVRASVTTLPDESNPGNNDQEVNVCPASAAPAPKPQGPASGAVGSVNQPGMGTATDVPTGQVTSTLDEARELGGFELMVPEPIPEHLRSGPHKIVRGVDNWRTVSQMYRSGLFYLCDGPDSPVLGMVGFSHIDFDDVNNCQINVVYETAMNFDLSDLREAYGKLLVGVATLTWDDTKHKRPGDEVTQHQQEGGWFESCVYELGKPTINWYAGDVGGLVPHEYYNDAPGIVQWDIVSLVNAWLGDPQSERYGVLLKGRHESLDADDDNACYSYVRNPRLEIEYTVLP